MSDRDIDAIQKAVMRRTLAEVAQAIAGGKGVDALDRDGRTALFYAAQYGDLAIAAELVLQGTIVNVQDKRRKTPLHFAAAACQTEVVELLLKHGAKVDAQDANGNTPLSDAVFESRGRGQMISLLLSSGADKTLKNNHGISPEDLAKSIGNYDVSKFL